MKITIEQASYDINSLNFSCENQGKTLKVYLPLKMKYAEVIALLTSCLGFESLQKWVDDLDGTYTIRTCDAIDFDKVEELIFYVSVDVNHSVEKSDFVFTQKSFSTD